MTQDEAFKLAVKHFDVSKSTRVLQECDGCTWQSDYPESKSQVVTIHTKGASVVIYTRKLVEDLAWMLAPMMSTQEQIEMATSILNRIDPHERKAVLRDFEEDFEELMAEHR